MADTKGVGGTDIKVGLKQIKKKCENLRSSHPSFVTVDDCCSDRATIQAIFPGAVVLQDLKHLIGRLVKQLSVRSLLYGDACKKLHGIFVGRDMTVKSRSGEFVSVAGRLLDPATQEKNLDEWITQYKGLDSSLFLEGFDNAATNQKDHIRKGCLQDPILDGLHYIELSDGKMYLLRGTNRDESLHSRINNIWPKRLGPGLAADMKLSFVYCWNCRKASRSSMAHLRPPPLRPPSSAHVGQAETSSSSSSSSSMPSNSSRCVHLSYSFFTRRACDCALRLDVFVGSLVIIDSEPS